MFSNISPPQKNRSESAQRHERKRRAPAHGLSGYAINDVSARKIRNDARDLNEERVGVRRAYSEHASYARHQAEYEHAYRDGACTDPVPGAGEAFHSGQRS